MQSTPAVAATLGVLILAASMISVELGLSIAIVEIVLGVLAGNLLHIHATPWIDFLAGFGSILLTFLAGAEVDPDLFGQKAKESLAIGGLSFLMPFLGCWAFAAFVLHWSPRAALIAGTALSTTSLAVVYAVLVETGLTHTRLGKLIMASTFVTDFGTALALSILFISPTVWLLPFIAASAVIILLMRALQPWFFSRYGSRVIEPELKGAFAALFLLMFLAAKAKSHAVLPAFILGLGLAKILARHREEQRRLRVVAFAFLTPFFFLKSGMNVSLTDVGANIGLVAAFFFAKVVMKFVGVYPVARKHLHEHAEYVTLLMSTGLTFGTISALFGLNAGIITRAQFSVLVAVVVLTAIVPTVIAQRTFHPASALEEPVPAEGDIPPEELV